jgi:ribonuclease D
MVRRSKRNLRVRQQFLRNVCFYFSLNFSKFRSVIDSNAALAPWLEKITACPVVAIDTEADSLYSYPERLCLIQIALPDSMVLVDPLADIDLAPLWESLKKTEIVIHAADYDLRLLYRRFGFVPEKIFDTMWAARLLGFREFGLHHLVTHFHSVDLEKGSQKADWGKRPLTDKMTEYALNDVRYLLEIRDSLKNLLGEADRTDWLDEMGQRLVNDAVRSVETATEDAWRGVKGSSRMEPAGLAYLRGLWQWREEEACRSNKPPYFVLNHENLVRVAELASEGKQWDITLPLRFSTRRRRGLQEVVEAVDAIPSEEWPEKKRSRRVMISESEKGRIEELKKIRDAKADTLGLDPTLIASKATLVALARDWENQLSQLMGWQRRLIES